MNPNQTAWITGSRCDSGSECVEVRFADNRVYVRSSRRPNDSVLVFDHTEWETFLRGAVDGEFTTPR